MLKIDDILKLSLFSNFKLIAGENGLQNEINNIVILEYESISKQYDVFSTGDFVLTSLFFAKDDISLLDDAFNNLFKIKVSGIAIKSIFYNDIPPHLKELAQQNNISIFIFENSYMEDLILCVNELLKSKQQYLAMEEKINSLINIEPSPIAIKNTALEINRALLENIVIAYITPKNKCNNIVQYFNRILYKKYQLISNLNYSFVKYKNGMLIIYSFNNTNKESIDFENILKKLLKNIDIEFNDFYIGISNIHDNLESFKVSILESVYANKICSKKGQDILYYSDIGIYKLLLPLTKDTNIMLLSNKIINELKEYDNQYTSNILDTLICYVNNNGEISKTSTELFQHPNTIRYRISKAKDILKKYDLNDNFYEQIYIIINVYLLSH